jgi:23S rRNA (uracil1939-C5)-methyltransferase
VQPFAFQFDVLENRKQLRIYLPHRPDDRDIRRLERLAREEMTFYWPETGEKSFSPLRIGRYDYLVSPAAFFQVNHFLWNTLLERVEKSILPGAQALDLYSGTGFFIPLLQKYMRNIIAVESHPLAAAALKKQFPATEVYPVTAEKASLPPADLLIADPPRSGLSRTVIRKILGRRYPRIIYISCNAATLARDCRTLVGDSHYRIDHIDLLDLFPQTPHLESVTLLTLPNQR